MTKANELKVLREKNGMDLKYREFENAHKKSHFLQSYEWGQFCKDAKGQVPRYVGMEDNDGNLIASCLILLRKTPFGFSYGYAPRGFVLDYSNKDVINEVLYAIIVPTLEEVDPSTNSYIIVK